MLAFEVPHQIVFNGAVAGMTYGVMAVGIILIFRSTRVINFAIGELGAFGAALLSRLVVNWDVGYWPSFLICVAVGALLGAALELLVVRRLFNAPRVILFVATIGAAQLLLFAQYQLPDLDEVKPYPTPLSHTWDVGDVFVRSEHVIVLVVVPILVTALAVFLNRTKYGIAIRAAAANSNAARLAAIDIKKLSTLVWALAGVLTTVATILAAPINAPTSSAVLALGPVLLLRVLAAALIARMTSVPIALFAGIAIGIGEKLLEYNASTRDRGVVDAALLVVVLIGLLPMARRAGQAAEARSTWSFAPRVRPVPPAVENTWWARRLPQLGGLIALALAMIPLVVLTRASQQELWSRMLLFAMITLSLTVLTGWAGQLSLGQFAFVGLGAATTAALVREGVGFVPAVLLAGGVGAVAAIVVGAPALRIPGLYLAVTTLAFAVACTAWLLKRDVFLDGQLQFRLPRQIVGSVSLQSQRTYYVVCLVVLGLTLLVVARVRRSGIGRTLIAVRDNEQAAAAVGISPARAKLTAFGIAGTICGVAGGLLMGLQRSLTPEYFSVSSSLAVISIAVIGGLASIPGTILGAAWVIGLPALLGNSPEITLLTSGAGLLILLLYFPGGFVQVLYSVRDNLFSWLARRRPAPERETPAAPLAGTRLPPVATVPQIPHVLQTEALTVRFGARVVVDGVALAIGRGEVVGLIGSNGAGKSTIMNAIGGFVPSRGTVQLLGRDVEHTSPAHRARLGLGRTFQGAELYSDLTVRETVQIALEMRARAGLLAVALGLPHARRVERAKRAEADEIIAFLGLGRFANRFINELSTGTRRIVELACLVGSGARVLCLDEPTAGIAQRESEAFGPLIRRIRDELDASVLVIEHDMPVVMGISDRVYCLEAGRIICEGDPHTVRNDPAVIASYLGTDEQAIRRSGSLQDVGDDPLEERPRELRR